MVNLLFLGFVWIVLAFFRNRKEIILALGALLLIFGLFAVYSVSVHESFTLTLKLLASGKWE